MLLHALLLQGDINEDNKQQQEQRVGFENRLLNFTAIGLFKFLFFLVVLKFSVL